MAKNPNQPKEYDVVKGGQASLPSGSASLGGLEGVKSRLASAVEEQRIAALSEALKYREAGLDLVIRALQDESKQVERAAYRLFDFQHHRICDRTSKPNAIATPFLGYHQLCAIAFVMGNTGNSIQVKVQWQRIPSSLEKMMQSLVVKPHLHPVVQS